MRANVVLGVFFIAITAVSAGAQQKPASGVAGDRPQWEYLVLSFGKAYFGDAVKTKNYSPIVPLVPNEADELQQSLDGLGKLGWELVSVVGIIGGDQELLLKRRSDPSLAKKEKDFLDKEGARRTAEFDSLLKKQNAEAARIQKLASEKKVLVDRDEIEAQQKAKDRDAEIAAHVTQMFDGVAADELTKKEKVLSALNYTITAQFDLTKDYLVETNEYSKSAVDKYLTDALEQVAADNESLGAYDLHLNYEGYITYGGKAYRVSQQQKDFGLSAWLRIQKAGGS
jgi:hypothetical protein